MLCLLHVRCLLHRCRCRHHRYIHISRSVRQYRQCDIDVIARFKLRTKKIHIKEYLLLNVSRLMLAHS